MPIITTIKPKAVTQRWYLRANASISAFLRSFQDGILGRAPFRRLGSPASSTRIFRYSSSSSVKFSALICSLITISGSKNQSKRVSLGLLSDVSSEPLPAYFTKEHQAKVITDTPSVHKRVQF